ncbi:butyrate kinase [Enterococcus sp. HY326]|uniref:butyrate kinase n=1 Tax=Enterococcus sp. HY326 TaxID=2971265 RepID=UPI00223EB02D|nr:butyrate kinase [Enterococcus sp. HY326]
MAKKILAINPGATSTKVAVYDHDKLLFSDEILHDLATVNQFETIPQQLPFRLATIHQILEKQHIQLTDLDAVVGRGGALPPVKAGGYLVTEKMMDYLLYETINQHVSNLGAVLAYQLAEEGQALPLVYDCVSVDQMWPISRVSGLKGMERKSLGHILNSRASGIKYCQQNGLDYHKQTLIVVHMGSGTTTSIHVNGEIADLISDDEGPMAVERTGGLPIHQVINWCYQYSKKEMLTFYKRQGGLVSYFDTNDARKIEARIADSPQEKVIYDAMIYQLAKGIASLATLVAGRVDQIVLTGGLAYSAYVTADLTKRIDFIAPVSLEPGENELEALAMGGLRILQKQEVLHEF